jgi:hypothetical protein
MNIADITRLVIKRIKELSPLTTPLTGEEYLAIYDPLTDNTFKIKSSLLKGASSTVEKWTSSNIYDQNNIAEWDLKLWLSLEDDNEGNIPSEGLWWTEVSKSEGNAINYYEAEKAYVVEPSVVLYNSRLYVFDTTVGTLPFYSTDIEAEILLGLWKRIDLDYDWTLVFIDNAATGLNNGTSWVNAYSDLKAGIEAAPDHSVIMVAARSYIVDEVITVKKNNIRIFGIPGLSNNQTPILTGDVEGDQSDLATNGTLIFEGLYCHLENFILEYFDTKTAGTGYSINARGDNFTYKDLKFRNIASYYGAMRLGSRNSVGHNLSFFNCIGTSCAGLIFARNTVAEVNNILFDDLYNTSSAETGSCLMDFGAMVKCKGVRIQNMANHVSNHTSAIYSVLSTTGDNANANLFIENLTVYNWNTLGRILRCWTSIAHVHNLLINNSIIDLSATAAFIATHSSKILITNGTINITGGRVLGNGGYVNSNLTTVNTIIQTPDAIHSLSDLTTEGQITHINSYLSAHTDITAISYTDCEYGVEPGFVSNNDLKLRDTSININKGQVDYLTENTQLSGIIKDIEGLDFKLDYVHRGCFQEQIYYIDKSDITALLDHIDEANEEKHQAKQVFLDSTPIDNIIIGITPIAIEFVRMYDPELSFQGFAKVGDSTPTATLNHAYICTATGTIFGNSVTSGQLLVGDGSVWTAKSVYYIESLIDIKKCKWVDLTSTYVADSYTLTDAKSSIFKAIKEIYFSPSIADISDLKISLIVFTKDAAGAGSDYSIRIRLSQLDTSLGDFFWFNISPTKTDNNVEYHLTQTATFGGVEVRVDAWVNFSDAIANSAGVMINTSNLDYVKIRPRQDALQTSIILENEERPALPYISRTFIKDSSIIKTLTTAVKDALLAVMDVWADNLVGSAYENYEFAIFYFGKNDATYKDIFYMSRRATSGDAWENAVIHTSAYNYWGDERFAYKTYSWDGVTFNFIILSDLIPAPSVNLRSILLNVTEIPLTDTGKLYLQTINISQDQLNSALSSKIDSISIKPAGTSMSIAAMGSSITWGSGWLDDGFIGYVDDMLKNEFSTTVLCDNEDVNYSVTPSDFENNMMYKGLGKEITGLNTKISFNLEGDEIAICQAIRRTANYALIRVKADSVTIGEFVNINKTLGSDTDSFTGDGSSIRFLLSNANTYNHVITVDSVAQVVEISDTGNISSVPSGVDVLVIRAYNSDGEIRHMLWFASAPANSAVIAVSYDIGRVVLHEKSTVGQTINDETNETPYGLDDIPFDPINIVIPVNGMEYRSIDKEAFWSYKFTEYKERTFEIEIIGGTNPYFILNFITNRYHNLMNAGIGGWQLQNLIDDSTRNLPNAFLSFIPDVLIMEYATNDDGGFKTRRLTRTVTGLSEAQVKELYTYELNRVEYQSGTSDFEVDFTTGIIDSITKTSLICSEIVGSGVIAGDIIRIGNYYGDNNQIVTREIATVDTGTGEITWLRPLNHLELLNIDSLSDLVGAECSIRDLSGYLDRYQTIIDTVFAIAPHINLLIVNPGLSDYFLRQLWGYDIIHRKLAKENNAQVIEVTNWLNDFQTKFISGSKTENITADGSSYYALTQTGHWQGFEVWVNGVNVYGIDCYIHTGWGYKINPALTGSEISITTDYNKDYEAIEPLTLVFYRNIPSSGTIVVKMADSIWSTDFCHMIPNGSYVYGQIYKEKLKQIL